MNAFVDARTTFNGESCLIIAIKNGYNKLIECMLDGIRKANGANSALIFNRILNSKFNKNQTVLNALIEFKLFSVLNFLVGQNNIQK